jgi:hypothetical protein
MHGNELRKKSYRPSYWMDVRTVKNKLQKYYCCNSVLRTAFFQCSLLWAISSRLLHSDVWWTTCAQKPLYPQPQRGNFSYISVSPITLPLTEANKSVFTSDYVVLGEDFLLVAAFFRVSTGTPTMLIGIIYGLFSPSG